VFVTQKTQKGMVLLTRKGLISKTHQFLRVYLKPDVFGVLLLRLS